ncbi:hypothetical protein FHX08_005265 [Rhizobium sp. BK529]|nr:hypothetical protein [Rhizobium sp. BK529]
MLNSADRWIVGMEIKAVATASCSDISGSEFFEYLRMQCVMRRNRDVLPCTDRFSRAPQDRL